MKKITLLLMMTLLGGITSGVKAAQTALFKGEFKTGNWASSQTLDKSLFAHVSEGDFFYVKWELDTEAAETYRVDHEEENPYYMFNMSYPTGTWSKKLISDQTVTNSAKFYGKVLTAEDVTNLKAYGLAFSGHCMIFTDLVIGDAFSSSTEIMYWGTEAWTSASTTNYVMPSEWSSCVLNGETIKSANIGDRLTVTFTPGSSDLWSAQLQIVDASNGWTTLMGIPVGGLSEMSLVVDEAVYNAFSRGDIRLSGANLTITNIQLETTTLSYRLSAYDNYVDITKLPTSQPVDIKLSRYFDWHSTICLPFDVANVSDAFDATLGAGTKVYEFSSYNDNLTNDNLTFIERGHMSAGVPYYMVRPYDAGIEDKSATIEFNNVTINTTHNDSEESNGVTFKGNYTVAMNMQNKFGVSCVNQKANESDPDNWVWAFYKGGEKTYLNAYSAYLDGDISHARLSIVFADEETTGVSAMEAVPAQKEYFNLSGLRISQPSKGLYIVNGKKVVVK